MISFDPIIPVYSLTFICLALLTVLAWPMMSGKVRRNARSIVTFIASIIIVCSVFAIGMRPYQSIGVDEVGETPGQYKSLDVVFVADTTLSMEAQDVDKGNRRLAMVDDAKKIVDLMPGASFSVISFANQVIVLAPFTTDTESVEDSLDTIYPLDSFVASGTNLYMPFEKVNTMLEKREQRDGHRMTLLFFMSDGEDTLSQEIQVSKQLRDRLDGGLVIGYGTQRGSLIPDGDGDYIFDYSTFEPAISQIDETSLTSLSKQLHIPYIHESENDKIAVYAKEMWSRAPSSDGSKPMNMERRNEYYFYFAIPLSLGLFVWLFISIGDLKRLDNVIGKKR